MVLPEHHDIKIKTCEVHGPRKFFNSASVRFYIHRKIYRKGNAPAGFHAYGTYRPRQYQPRRYNLRYPHPNQKIRRFHSFEAYLSFRLFSAPAFSPHYKQNLWRILSI
mgnify:CR=1 FL=1